MRANGELYTETRTAGGVNQWGEPLGDSVQWSETPIACLVTPNADTRLGRYEDGEFRQASYTVIIEGEGLSAERVRLVRGGETLGEYRIMSIRPLPSAGRVQINV